jgi:hypothetical protein
MTRRIALVLVTVALAAAAGTPVRGQGAEAYKALVGIHEEFVKLRPPRVTAGVPDYTPTAIAEQRRGLDALRKRLAAIDPAAWPVPQQVDYHLVRAELNGLDFDHRVVRPWQRDPGLYVDLIRRAPHADVPATGQSLERLRTQLQAVPRIVEQARANLTNASGELAGQAIRELEMSDGVNQGEPRRPVPPAGVIGWYRDLRERLPKHHPELVADARAALAAAEGFRDWLKQNRPAMKEPAFVGLDNYNWYLRNVRLMPYDADQVRLLGKREEDRARTFLEIEQHRNRALPPIEPVKTAEEHEKRVRDSERLIREFIQNHKLLTIPADAPAEFETDAFWIVREGGKRHFWEELTYRDPLNNHIHASIPGHQFDAHIQRKNTNPIRAGYRDGARAEGWGFYIEEMFLQAGLLDGRPRARELFYIAQLKRAIRIPCELEMQAGRFTLQHAIDHMVREVPLMEPDLARYDLAIYLRRPTYGMNYIMGKLQLESLLNERVRQLGDKFDLGKFHDEFLAAGPIPISLIRWEMTGRDDEIRKVAAPGTQP